MLTGPPAPLFVHGTMSLYVSQGGHFFLGEFPVELKSATTFDEQLELLQKRNCFVSDPVFCKQVLQQVNYYRFSAYFLPFKKADGTYYDGTSFHRVFRIYEFDRKMRRMLFSAIEQIELYLRTQLAYFHGHKYGPLGYMDLNNYSNKHNHERFQKLFQDEVQHNKNVLFVKHHIEKYGGDFPIWVATELFSFGMLSYFYSDMITADKKTIARELYGTTYKNLDSWLRCCTDLRNICAHYGRLYYRVFSAVPSTPDGFPIILNRRLFDNIAMLKFLYPNRDRWNYEVLTSISALIEEYRGDIALDHIGFLAEWKNILTAK